MATLAMLSFWQDHFFCRVLKAVTASLCWKQYYNRLYRCSNGVRPQLEITWLQTWHIKPYDQTVFRNANCVIVIFLQDSDQTILEDLHSSTFHRGGIFRKWRHRHNTKSMSRRPSPKMSPIATPVERKYSTPT